jgi:hypothetical protein
LEDQRHGIKTNKYDWLSPGMQPGARPMRQPGG